jgi:cytochrome c oxidase subunit IV
MLNLDPFGALVKFYAARKEVAQMERAVRLGLAVWGSSFVAFWGTWGTSIWALHAQDYGTWLCLVLGFANACISMAVCVAVLWKRNDLTKDLPLAIPGKIAEKLIEGGGAATGGVEYSEGPPKK